MPFIEAKCKNCGGDIRLDDSLTKGRCEYCGTEFVKSDMVVHHNYAIQNATLVVNEEDLTEQMFVNAETYLVTLRDYDKALESYQAITRSKVNDYRGWWGLVRAMSRDFTLMECPKDAYTRMCSYADNALKLAPPDRKTDLARSWDSYRRQVEGYLASRDAAFAEWMDGLRRQEQQRQQARRLRRIIADILAIAANLAVILYALTVDLSPLNRLSHDLTPLVYIAAALGINALLCIVFQLIGTAPECFIFQVIGTIAVLGYLGYRIVTSGHPDTTVLVIGSLVVGVGGILAAAVFLVLPLLVYKRLRRSVPR